MTAVTSGVRGARELAGALCGLLLVSPAWSQTLDAQSTGQLLQTRRAQQAVQKHSPRLRRALEQQDLELGAPIFMRIFKESSELEVWVEGAEGRYRHFRTYRICAFPGDLGPKTAQGDCQAPEGFYFVPAGMMAPWSRFHLAFNLGYPNAYDRSHGRRGGALMVHGSCVSIGCFAMTDRLIEELYTLAFKALSHGQPFFRVHIFPFRMTQEALARRSRSPWHGFWRNLKEGFDHFEERGRPPSVGVQDGRYVFSDG